MEKHIGYKHTLTWQRSPRNQEAARKFKEADYLTLPQREHNERSWGRSSYMGRHCCAAKPKEPTSTWVAFITSWMMPDMTR